MQKYLSLLLTFISFFTLSAEKLLLISDAPYVLDKSQWKNFFSAKNWRNDEILEADKEHLFIHLNTYRIPKDMEWNKPGWGLWNIQKNHFQPLPQIPSHLIPIRKTGDTIFVRNANATFFGYTNPETGNQIHPIASSVKIRGWFPRTDGTVVYILEGEECSQKKGARIGKGWSVCRFNSDLKTIDSITHIEPIFNPMLTGSSDNYLVYWKKDYKEKVWVLEVVNLEKGNTKIIGKSNKSEFNSQSTPKWLSWIGNDRIVYEKMDWESNGNPSTPHRSFIVHNLSSDQRKEILLERKGTILLEPGNRGTRRYQYQPYLVVMDYAGEDNPIKVIDPKELKIITETLFPLEETLTEKWDRATYYP